jgi:hypothetical protein
LRFCGRFEAHRRDYLDKVVSPSIIGGAFSAG